MQFDESLKKNIRNLCRVSTDEDGDVFVGIKADSNNISVSFPLGYEIPKSDNEIRKDIKHLIWILSEFTTKEDRLIALNKFQAPQFVDFPINAYRELIEYYLCYGYYVEKDVEYKTSSTGNKNWAKTVKNQKGYIQQKNGVSSLIFNSFSVRNNTPNSNKIITQINRYCVYEAFDKMGWLYIPTMPEPAGEHPDNKVAISILNTKINNTNNDKVKSLFRSMLALLKYKDEETSNKMFYFGTDKFEDVWEKIVDRAFGEKNKDDYFPRAKWQLDYGHDRVKYPLQPDTIMLFHKKIYILDSKYYRYGVTGKSENLPNSSDINKQITYGEYVYKNKMNDNNRLFNAFVMPYNKASNYFGFNDIIGNVGESRGDWRHNDKYYERIQGIVIDTRYLLYNYTGELLKEKEKLSDQIEKVKKRKTID